MNNKLKLILFSVMIVAAATFVYRIASDSSVSGAVIGGLIAVSALAIITLVSERLVEFTAGAKGVSAKLGQLESRVSDIKTFLLGSIGEDSITTLREISAGRLESPADPKQKDELKFRLNASKKRFYTTR